MAESHPSDFDGAFDFFVLSGLSDGPRSISEIQQRVAWAERLLYLAAARKGKRGPGSLSDVLRRLQSDGCLSLEQSGTKRIYSLTDAGKRRLDEERTRQKAIASQFVEDGELDSSFRNFLDRHGPLSRG